MKRPRDAAVFVLFNQVDYFSEEGCVSALGAGAASLAAESLLAAGLLSPLSAPLLAKEPSSLTWLLVRPEVERLSVA